MIRHDAPMTHPPSIISLSGVQFAYSTGWNLSCDALTLGTERICGIIGPNGSGKSTLLRLAGGLLFPQCGKIEVAGQPISALNRATLAKQVGFLPQQNPVLFDYTVEQIVEMGRYAYGRFFRTPSTGDTEAIESALRHTDLLDLRTRPLSRLSGGEQRRAFIASTLAQRPKIVLLDEPTAGLDIHYAADTLNLFRKQMDFSCSVVVVLHDLNMAALFCDRLLLMSHGRIVADGIPSDVITTTHIQREYGPNIHVEVGEHAIPVVSVRLPE